MAINDLRAEVLKRQKAANAKISRLKRKGVELAGTVHDVRREPANVSRYNTRQLRAYMGELNQFMKRTNQFVAGSEGAPIRAGVWKNYKRQEAEYSNFIQQHYNSVKDTFIDQSGLTVGEFDRRVRPKRERGKGGIPRALEQFSELQPWNVVSESKLETLRQNMVRKLAPDFVSKMAQEQKYKILQAVTVFGDKELMKTAEGLTLEQVDTLFNYTAAPYDLFAGYHMMQLLSNSPADQQQSMAMDSDADEARDWINWAENLPPRNKGK